MEASTSSKLGAFKDLNGQSTFPGQGGTLVGSLDKPIVKPAKVKGIVTEMVMALIAAIIIIL